MLPDGKAANVPFFSLLIQKIEESDTLTLQFDLPAFIQKLLLQTPRHLSSFLRFVRRHVHKAFSKQSFSSLKDIPVMLQAKPSVVGDVCENAGLSSLNVDLFPLIINRHDELLVITFTASSILYYSSWYL